MLKLTAFILGIIATLWFFTPQPYAEKGLNKGNGWLHQADWCISQDKSTCATEDTGDLSANPQSESENEAANKDELKERQFARLAEYLSDHLKPESPQPESPQTENLVQLEDKNHPPTDPQKGAGSYLFHSPFSSKTSAQAVAKKLQELSGLNVQISQIETGYIMKVDYASEQQRLEIENTLQPLLKNRS